MSPYPAGSLRELLVVAIPLVISAGSHAVMMFFDRVFLVKYSNVAFAASLPAGTVIWSMLAVPLGIVAYATTFVAQYHGAGNRLMVRKSVWHALGAAVIFGALLVVLGWPLGSLFESLGHGPEVAAAERAYFEVMLWICPVRIFVAAIAAFFNGRGRTKIVMTGSLIGMVANIGLDWMLIFGCGPIPELGIRGAGIATVLALAINMLFLLGVLIFENRHDRQLWAQAARFDTELAGRMLRFGTPAGFQFLFDIGAITVVVMLVGRISDEALGSTNLAFQLNSMLFIPLIGLSQAVSTIVGHRVGEDTPLLAKRSVRMAMWLGLAWSLPFLVAFVCAPRLVLQSIEVFAPGSLDPYASVMPTLLCFVAAYSVFDLMAAVYCGAIRGAGDTKFALYVFIVVNWGVMVAPLVVLELADANTLFRSWTVITLMIAILGIVFFWRYRSDRWTTMSVIEPDVTAGDAETSDSPVGDVCVSQQV